MRIATGRDQAAFTYVTAMIDDQLCGISVLDVQDVLGPQKPTRVPLAPRAVVGALNLRGRIVTAVDLRIRLDLPPRIEGEGGMNIVVETGGALYSLNVDSVGDVIEMSEATLEATPPTLDPVWRQCSSGVHRLAEGLLVVLDVDALLAPSGASAAA